MMLAGAIYLIRMAMNLAHSEGRRVRYAELLLGLMVGYISTMVFLFMLLQDVVGWSHSRVVGGLEFLFFPLLAMFTWFMWLLRRAIDKNR
jgi:hypothetical protein